MNFENKQPDANEPYEPAETSPTRDRSPAERRKIGKYIRNTLITAVGVGAVGVGIGIATHDNESSTFSNATTPETSDGSTIEITAKQQQELQWIQAHLDSKAATVPADLADPTKIDWRYTAQALIPVKLHAGEGVSQAAIEQFAAATGHDTPVTIADSLTIAGNNLVDHLRETGEETHLPPDTTFNVEEIILDGQERAVIINVTPPQQ